MSYRHFAQKIINKHIDVNEELETATQYHLNKLSTNFDMVYIIEEQNNMDKTI